MSKREIYEQKTEEILHNLLLPVRFQRMVRPHGGDDSPLTEAILDRIMHDAYKINIVPTDPSNYRSMREVYGFDPVLSE